MINEIDKSKLGEVLTKLNIHVHGTTNLWGSAKVGKNTKIGAFCDIGHADIGSDCKIQCHVSIPPGWKIGDRVFIGPGAKFANDKHPDIKIDFTPVGGIIEDDVVIGIGAIILPVRIGKGAIIGAGAVVTKECEAGKTYIGNPAHLI